MGRNREDDIKNHVLTTFHERLSTESVALSGRGATGTVNNRSPDYGMYINGSHGG